ncbi:MAG: triose-phosphate isomerase [Clostridia bacterium]|nr:triose-phosphate isomerase [Clostridia bacterium]
MNYDKRKTIIAGNWKMNKLPSETYDYIKEVAAKTEGAKCEVVACVPFVNLQNAIEAAKGTHVKIGAENLHFKASGAFTGEISAAMLKDLGVEYVIIGHSERRQYFAETDITVNLKVLAALEAGLKPIVCVGELLDEREQGITAEIVSMQTKIAFMGVGKSAFKDIVIAYEPVWAIGTGKTATSDQAEEVCKIIRDVICGLYDEETAEGTTIQYGGSMNAGNAKELLGKYDVDGGLIGGASLKSDDFAAIVKAAE